ncbi:MAG: acyl carrier protein [Deltaproteobacteria bacterium]|nr:acyl carrier protein [Deltaproteobacteria bacterium]
MSTHKSIEVFLIADPELASGRDTINHEEPLIEGGLIDSMGILKLIAFLEEEYKVTFEDEDITAENFATINAIAALVQKHDGLNKSARE